MRFQLPQDLSALSAEDLSNLIEEARNEFNELNESESVADEVLESMGAIADGIEALQAEQTRRTEAVSRKEALSARVPAPLPEAPAAPAASAEVEVPVEPEIEPEVVETREPALVAAATPPVPSVAIPESTQPLVVITAAADVPGYPVSSNLDPRTLADALHAKARNLTNQPGRSVFYPVATINRPFLPEYDLSTGSESEVWEKIEAGTKPSALTAAGGWCAPSQILYDLFEVECTNDQLFRLPTFRVTRGGIRWPVFVPHDGTFDPGFVWTEEDDIAATSGTPTKPCIRIPCPTFTECRLDAVGLCITAGNLMDRAYPEQIRWFIARAIRAFERVDSIRQLNAVIADSIPVAIPETFGTASALVGALLLQAADYRETNGLCCGQQLDVILPCWVSDMVKADIARSQNTFSLGNLPSDADVRAWFAAANLNVSFINYWQTITGDPATVWPATVQFLIGYPGSWTRFDGGSLDLGVTRDSVLNETNDFTAVWFENFYCIGRRGPQSRIVTVPVCASGEAAGLVDATGTAVCA